MKIFPSAAKAANLFGCLIAALEALRHPKALFDTQPGAVPFQSASRPTSRKKREKWGTRVTLKGAAHIQCGVTLPWHA